MTNHTTRESWLTAAVELLSNDLFAPHGFTVPTVRVSVGWPHRGQASTIGQCFPGHMAADKVGQIFISPKLGDDLRVLDVLAHEMVHAINHAEGKNGHGKDFSVIAKKIGLTGKMTATVAGDDLQVALAVISAQLGPYPHSALIASNAPQGPSRSGKAIKLECSNGDDYIVSISKSRLENLGAPKCPCHDLEMVEA